MNNIKILVAHHKPGYIYKDDIFEPIQVGRANSKVMLPMIGDDTGDNISDLNPYYCEMTAVYWAWKNLKDMDYVGLCHYRRYLIDGIKFKNNNFTELKFNLHKLLGLIYKSKKTHTKPNQILYKSANDLEIVLRYTTELLKVCATELKYNLLLPSKYEFANRSTKAYFEIIGKDYIETLILITKQRYPKFLIFLEQTLGQTYIYPANIFVMDKIHFGEYCTLQFDLLSAHMEIYKENINFEKKYSRISGYLSELISNAFFNKLINEGAKYKVLTHALVDF